MLCIWLLFYGNLACIIMTDKKLLICYNKLNQNNHTTFKCSNVHFLPIDMLQLFTLYNAQCYTHMYVSNELTKPNIL